MDEQTFTTSTSFASCSPAKQPGGAFVVTSTMDSWMPEVTG